MYKKSDRYYSAIQNTSCSKKVSENGHSKLFLLIMIKGLVGHENLS